MSIPSENIRVGKCYLALAYGTGPKRYPRIRRVVEILPDGRVWFEQRRGAVAPGRPWPGRNTMMLKIFANSVEREVPCDWTAETDGQSETGAK